jgi:hypothetical protein
MPTTNDKRRERHQRDPVFRKKRNEQSQKYKNKRKLSETRENKHIRLEKQKMSNKKTRDRLKAMNENTKLSPIPPNDNDMCNQNDNTDDDGPAAIELTAVGAIQEKAVACDNWMNAATSTEANAVEGIVEVAMTASTIEDQEQKQWAVVDNNNEAVSPPSPTEEAATAETEESSSAPAMSVEQPKLQPLVFTHENKLFSLQLNMHCRDANVSLPEDVVNIILNCKNFKCTVEVKWQPRKSVQEEDADNLEKSCTERLQSEEQMLTTKKF